jgi:putative beta-lysine N-acetyltransferase
MIDVVEKLGESTIQHGKLNDRIYLMKLAVDDLPGIIHKLDNLAAFGDYSKIFAKIPASAIDGFETDGYTIEAHIPDFFNGNEDSYFISKYLSGPRRYVYSEDQLDQIVIDAKSKYLGKPPDAIPDGYRLKMLEKSDVSQIAEVYKQVFQTYPFPIHDPEYLKKTMDENVIYFAILKEDELVALSSAEIDIDSKNVEMTDFATLPEYRGKGFATYLLKKMETEVRGMGIKLAYTIARASSRGVNIAFGKMGYEYGGMLANNTNISGNLESMNVWYKKL